MGRGCVWRPGRAPTRRDRASSALALTIAQHFAELLAPGAGLETMAGLPGAVALQGGPARSAELLLVMGGARRLGGVSGAGNRSETRCTKGSGATDACNLEAERFAGRGRPGTAPLWQEGMGPPKCPPSACLAPFRCQSQWRLLRASRRAVRGGLSAGHPPHHPPMHCLAPLPAGWGSQTPPLCPLIHLQSSRRGSGTRTGPPRRPLPPPRPRRRPWPPARKSSSGRSSMSRNTARR